MNTLLVPKLKDYIVLTNEVTPVIDQQVIHYYVLAPGDNSPAWLSINRMIVPTFLPGDWFQISAAAFPRGQWKSNGYPFVSLKLELGSAEKRHLKDRISNIIRANLVSAIPQEFAKLITGGEVAYINSLKIHFKTRNICVNVAELNGKCEIARDREHAKIVAASLGRQPKQVNDRWDRLET